jgi:hypothetical protein
LEALIRAGEARGRPLDSAPNHGDFLRLVGFQDVHCYKTRWPLWSELVRAFLLFGLEGLSMRLLTEQGMSPEAVREQCAEVKSKLLSNGCGGYFKVYGILFCSIPSVIDHGNRYVHFARKPDGPDQHVIAHGNGQETAPRLTAIGPPRSPTPTVSSRTSSMIGLPPISTTS